MRLLIVCHGDALPGARVLGHSFRAACPDSSSTVIVAEQAADLGIESFGALASMFSARDLARALVPFALARAMEGESEPVMALAPDARVLSDLAPVDDALASAAAVLVPRHLQLNPMAPEEPVFDDGFIALAGEEGRRLATWWGEQVLHEGPDTAWLDYLPAVSERVALLRDRGCAVAPWNFGERALERDGDGRLLSGGAPVRWLRLPGVRPDTPSALEGARVSEHPELRELVVRHAAELARERTPAAANPYERTASGIELDDRLRRLYAHGRRKGALTRDVFDAAGAAEFVAWLREPDVGAVSRYLCDIYRERADLQQQYPDLRRPEDRDGFHGWAIVHGRDELRIPDALLPPEPAGLRVPPEPPQRKVSPPWGVNVAGYFQSELGVGEAARRVVEALDAAHVPVLPVQGSVVPPSRRGQDFGSVGAVAPFAINLVCVNADGLPAFARDVGPAFFANRYTIGHWAWEVTLFPERWHEAFSYLDEVWVHSDHLLDTLAAVSPIPVRKLRMPVEVPPPPLLSRAELGLPEGTLFYFMFDYHSVFERKNPLALVEAFKRAFAPEDGMQLVLKCINAPSDPANHERLLLAAAERQDIRVIDRYVTATERDAMLAACDCYVSLHRAEGFGFTIAEAMYLGKAVIATGYSGNLDYMPPETGWLVPYELAPIGEGHDPYPPEGVWADPDLDAAAAAMRAVADDREEAQARGMRAAAVIRANHSPAAAGQVMAQRLETIRLDVAVRVRSVDEEAVERARTLAAPLRERLAAGPDAFIPPDAGRLRRFGRRALLRALRPLSGYQTAVDDAVARAIEEGALDAERRGEQARLDQFALYASALARARRTQAESEAERRRLTSRAAATEAGVAEVRTGLRALPYTAGDPFEYFAEPVAGRVQGFRDNPVGEAEEAEDYRYFEDVFRGPRERVAGLVEPYVELLHGRAPVLDFGCGRGEMLEALAAAGIEARGVDSDEGMAAQARALGLDVKVGDGIAYLDGLADRSLGAVFSCQVIEHLSYDALRALLRLSRAKIREGGLLIAETVNPHALHAMKAFWTDPTHQHPLFPEVMLTLCAAAGYRSAYVCHLHGVRDVEQDRFHQSSFAVVATV
jgi:glycosyltransferase involved in cell wall biosynthesis/SAM-dependent methyltransferase